MFWLKIDKLNDLELVIFLNFILVENSVIIPLYIASLLV